MLATLFLFSTAVVSVPAVAEPVWSVSEGERIAVDTVYGAAAHAVLPEGGVFLIVEDNGVVERAATVHMDAAGTVQAGQIGHRSDGGAQLKPQRILATAPGRVLAAMAEPSRSRVFLVMLDPDGTVRWTRAGQARDARFFADGDVLLQSGHQLMRLAGSDGAVRWSRNVLDLSFRAVEAAYALPNDIESAIQLAVRHRDADQPAFGDPLFVSFAAADGQLQWRRARAPAALASDVFQSCPQIGVGGDTVYAWSELVGAQVDVVVERRAAADGALLWATRVPSVRYSDGPCGFTASSSQIVMSTHDQSAGNTLFAVRPAGDLAWRIDLPPTGASRLLPLPGGDVLVSSQISAVAVGDGTLLQRRDFKGSQLWSATLAGGGVEPRVVNGEAVLAWSTSGQAATLSRERRALDSGALLDAQQADAVSYTQSAADVAFIDGVPFGVSAARGADQRGLRVRRLDVGSGSPVWSQELTLDESVGRAVRVTLVGGAVDRVLLYATYQHADGRSRIALVAIEKQAGAVLWQRAFDAAPFNGHLPLVHADGSVYLAHGRCMGEGCTSPVFELSRLAAATGVPVWAQPRRVLLQGLRGQDAIALSFPSVGSDAFQVSIDGQTGLDRWSQPLPADLWNRAVQPLAPEDVATLYETGTVDLRRLHLQRHAGATGIPVWSAQPGTADEDLRAGILTQFAPDQFLLTARLRVPGTSDPVQFRPHIDRIDPATGAVRWTARPPLLGDRWRSLRMLPGGTASEAWARSLRFVPGIGLGEERHALTTVALADGAVGGEHLFARSYDGPLDSTALGTFGAISAVTPDGALLETSAADGAGLEVPRLQRLPPVSGDHGDLVLRRLGQPGTLTALGPDAVVELEISNPSAAAVADLVLGFESTDSQLAARLLDCIPATGTAGCIPLPAKRELGLTLGALSTLRVRYVVYDPGFQPAAAASDPRRGLFYLDPPYSHGDPELGNNIVELQVRTGGFSDSFE